jgi:hypothetical protein
MITGQKGLDAVFDRFDQKVQRVDEGCWEWLGWKSNGYGRFKFRGRNVSATKFSYERFVGEVPEGLLVLHRCDNPGCVRPDHLFVGTSRDNTQDMLAKGRHRAQRGSEHHRAKLDEEKVALIRARVRDGEAQVALAREFGVSAQLVNDIIRRRRWGHVE